MALVYEVLLHLVFLVAMPFFLVLGVARGKYLPNLRERLGRFRGEQRSHDIWMHAVSVGETLAAKPIVEQILRIRPGTSIVFTTTTLTGQAQAQRLYPQATVTYFPFDFHRSVRRFLEHHRPRAFVTMETEIWPNVTRLSRAAGLRLVLANGRISDRSFPRYRLFRAVVGRLLSRYDAILAREERDRERFVAIGAPPQVVETTGNVKFDYEADAAPLAEAPAIERLIAGRKVVVLGSTVEGEDEMLLPAIAALSREDGLFVIVAPRKQERFEPVAKLLAATGLRVVRRSRLAEESGADVLLLDTFGELSRIYRYAAAAFVGGSLVPHGGHNPIEPAAAGVPVCFGPAMSNFDEIASILLASEAAAVVRDAAGLRAFMVHAATDAQFRGAMGERGRATVARNRGASERTARRILELLA